MNAAEAIEAGSYGTIRVTTKTQEFTEPFLETHCESESVAPGTYVLLEVKDSGKGMDAKTLARIFDPFFLTNFAGRGLGLAAMLGILRGHKAGIVVESTPGQGTAFQVRFPVSDRAVSVAVESKSQPLRGTGLVLVVDDNEAVRNLVRHVLTSYGYDVLLAEDGCEAVKKVEKQSPEISVVLLDVNMPNMGGIEALQRIKALRSDIKIVVSSGNEADETERLFEAQTVSAFLPKPFSSLELAAAVHRVITSPKF